MPITATRGLKPPGPAERYTLNADPPTLELLTRLTAEYGETLLVHSADRRDPSYVLHDPEHIRQVLVSNYGNYVKGVGFERVKLLLGNGIIVSDGEEWRRQRTLIQPAFSRKSIARLAETIRRQNLTLREEWRALTGDKPRLDITTAMSHAALEVILRAIFSDDLDALEHDGSGNPFAFLASDPSRDIRTVVRLRELERVVLACIERRQRSGDRPADFLSAMMDARDKTTGTGMTSRQLLDEVKTLIVAGHETSAGTLNWTWYLLSRHPDAEARLLREIKDHVPGDQFTLDALMALPYLGCVLRETLRLYPPVWLFSRRAVADDDFGDFQVPAGAHVFISPYLVHRRPHLWPEPEEFRPERFADPDAEARNRTAFIPFSAGARRCIGEHFAFVEMYMHMAIMLQSFHLGLEPGQQVRLDPSVNLRVADGIMMSIQQRSDAPR
jgi:cytochrome P450